MTRDPIRPTPDNEVHPLVAQALAQGFPITVADPVALARIATLIRRPDRQVRRAA